MEGEGEISLATEEAAVGPLVNGEQCRGVEAVAVGGEAGGSQRHEEIDFENSDAPESQPWELPSPLPRPVLALAVLRLDNARLRVAFPSRLSLSPVSLDVMVSLECRRLLASSLALALAGTHFPVVSLAILLFLRSPCPR